MIGKIISVKGSSVYVSLSINIYQVDNLIGRYVTFADRFIGEVIGMTNTTMEVSLIGEIVNKSFVPGNLNLPYFGSNCSCFVQLQCRKA